MAGKVFCAGAYNNGLLLAIVKGNKITAQKYCEGSFLYDGILMDSTGASNAVKEFLAANKVKPKSVKLFIKTSKALSRLSEFPRLCKRDLQALKKQDLQDFFPVPVNGYVTGFSVAYSNAEKTVLYVTAIPEGVLNAFTELFHGLKIELRYACIFQDLLIKSFDGSNNIIAVIENNNKSNIILYNCGVPRAIRDLAFSGDTFIEDFKNVLGMYSMDETGEFYLFGARYEQFCNYFATKGIVYDGPDTINRILNRLCDSPSLNILPPPHKNKVKINKAIKICAACMAVIFLSTILMVISIEHTKSFTLASIQALSEELGSKKFLESDEAAQKYASLTNNSESIALDYTPTVIFDTLLEVFSCLPPDTSLNKISLESKKRNITLIGVTKTDEEILKLTDSLMCSGVFLNVELTDIKLENSVYRFSISFSYR